MQGKKVMISGSTSGIGEAAARQLAAMGAELILIARDKQKVTALIEDLNNNNKNLKVDYLLCDLSSQNSIRKMVNEFKQKHDHLDVLINNAGAIFHSRQLSADGLEKTFALNHMGYFLVTELLLDILKSGKSSRIVNVASATHYGAHIDFSDIMNEKFYDDHVVYAQTKLMNVLFTYDLARKLADSSVTANCLHPGVVRTNFGKDENGNKSNYIKYPFALSPEKGADTVVYLATSDEVRGITGKYFEKRKMLKSSEDSYDKYIADKLRRVSESYIKETIPC